MIYIFVLDKKLVQKGDDYHKTIIQLIRDKKSKYTINLLLISPNDNITSIVEKIPNLDTDEITFLWDINIIKYFSTFIDLNKNQNVLIMDKKSNIFYNINDMDINENYVIFNGMKVLYLNPTIDKNVLQQYDIIYKDYIFDF